MPKREEKASSRRLKAELRKAGLSNEAIQAAWPSWWSQNAEGSPSAQAELRFALARKLGLSAPGLLSNEVSFVWNEEAKFKHQHPDDESTNAPLASFAIAVGQLLSSASIAVVNKQNLDAVTIRRSILNVRQYVDLQGLLVVCWSIGVPVIHLRVFPLNIKGMHAVAVRAGVGYAILLGRDASYPAPVAFDLAHELGHIARGHLSNATAMIDADDPISQIRDRDREETEADQFALMLLTGQAEPDIRSNITQYTARQLARAAMASGQARRIEPGTLALCAAHRTAAWQTAFGAMKQIYDSP